MVSKARIDNQASFILHTYPWSETSLIVETFTRDYGRIPLMAKGARRPTSTLRGVLMAFQPLLVSWTGKSEVKTLTQAQWQGGQALLGGLALLCGYYLNELMMRLLPREDAHPELFDLYQQSLAQLSLGMAHEPILRAFELGLLRELGYGVMLDIVAQTGELVRADERYVFLIEHGICEADGYEGGDAPIYRGQTLLAMSAGDFSQDETLQQAKVLMRRLLHHYLGGAGLESRRILIELQAL